MKKKEELFFLIRSLSPSEIRFIRIQFGKEETNYVRLFEAIRMQEVYDEDAIRLQFEGESFLNQLTATKYYLRKQILRSLRQFERDKFEVDELLANVSVLFDKGLYSLAEGELKRAERLAREQEDFPALYRAASWRRRLTLMLRPQDYAEIGRHVAAQHKAATQLHELGLLWQQNIDFRSAKEYPDSALSEDSVTAYVMQQVLNYRKKLMGMSSIRDIGEVDAISHLEAARKRLEDSPGLLRSDPYLYLNTLNNLVGYYARTGETDEALAHLERIRTFLDGQKKLTSPLIKALLRAWNTQLEIYRSAKDVERAMPLIAEIGEWMVRQEGRFPDLYRFSFYFQFAYFHFLGKDFKTALHWLNQIFNTPRKEVPNDLLTFAHWLNLIVHYELRNGFVLRYFVDSTRRFLRKRKQTEAYEKILLGLFVKLGRLPGAEHKAEFARVAAELAPEGMIPGEVRIFLDFLAWVKEKS